MANDSSTGGYLAPLETLPDDDALDLQVQPIIAGITGLDGTLVRRRGQAVPGAQPPRTATWCSFACSTTDADLYPSIVHDGHADSGQGRDVEYRTETIDVSCAFFGPAAVATAKRLRDGFNIAQNREAMRASGLGYVSARPVTFLPDLENGQFIRRADVTFRLRRMVIRSYAVRNIVEVDGVVIAQGQAKAGPSLIVSPFDVTTEP